MSEENKSEEKRTEFDIPARGSLGLLAYGDLGIEAWRKKRTEHRAKQIAARENNKTDKDNA